jgi:hypothetical protein
MVAREAEEVRRAAARAARQKRDEENSKRQKKIDEDKRRQNQETASSFDFHSKDYTHISSCIHGGWWDKNTRPRSLR